MTGQPSASNTLNAAGAVIGTPVNAPAIVLHLRNVTNAPIAVGDVVPAGTGATPIVASTCPSARRARRSSPGQGRPSSSAGAARPSQSAPTARAKPTAVPT